MKTTAKLVMPFDKRGDNAYLRVSVDGVEKELWYMRKVVVGGVKGIEMHRCRDNETVTVQLDTFACSCGERRCQHAIAIHNLKAKGKLR